jgi:hypothetical protein
VTGEPFTYAGWGVGEPNNDKGNESYLQYFTDSSNPPAWNDATVAAGVRSYVVEYE